MLIFLVVFSYSIINSVDCHEHIPEASIFGKEWKSKTRSWKTKATRNKGEL